MALLAEYAITPDVFDKDSYSSEGHCAARLDTIREIAVEEGIVRDLRAGMWRTVFANHGRPWHRRAKEIVKKLYTQGRLVEFPSCLPLTPSTDREWCAEALAGHDRESMGGGVIVTEKVKDAYRREQFVEQIDRPSHRWRRERSPSVTVSRTLADYRAHLQPILRYARSLQFIDPHLNPAKKRYRQFVDLVESAGSRAPAPRIEIHRSEERVGSRSDGTPPCFERIFRSTMEKRLRAVGLRAEVFIWDYFHERFLLSNLIGIHMGNGFDTRPHDTTMWNRLGRPQHDEKQRYFDPAHRSTKLRKRFSLR